ncbi:hypothetical protein Cgig2_021979 [Carnegiea gigantea]|uniref:Uncharacterized protein n=1 Tax=Carnegiea gigantea TaxID=171969 RepID=A0A9Q1QNW0_9CARY|nr:hypothetical protein Cgig2_021979 [Carnegiea gigantea]
MKALNAHQFLLSSARPTSFILSKPSRNLRLRTPFARRFRACRTDQISAPNKMSSPNCSSSLSLMASGNGSSGFRRRGWVPEAMEEAIEKAIYQCRFLTLLGVLGSLVGSVICFIKGCNIVAASFSEHVVRSGKVMTLLAEALGKHADPLAPIAGQANGSNAGGGGDGFNPQYPSFCSNCKFPVMKIFTDCYNITSPDVYLLGTVMLVFGMGLYELFVCNIDIEGSLKGQKFPYRSNLFGLFTLMVILNNIPSTFFITTTIDPGVNVLHSVPQERPKWLEIKSVNELKTKVGHVIVMLLLIGFFDNSNKVAIHSPIDLLCFSASILLCSICLYLLAQLNGSKQKD